MNGISIKIQFNQFSLIIFSCFSFLQNYYLLKINYAFIMLYEEMYE